MDNYTILERPLTPEEYLILRAETTWREVTREMVMTAVKNSLFSVIILREAQPVAMGRIVGDGGLYFYLQDVIVHREYRNQGLARMVMVKLESYLEEHAEKNAFIGLMAAEGVAGLYESFGYVRRNDTAPGMFKYWTLPGAGTKFK